ncbi:hypothetical protein diail_9272 [Diaporthe ilicicola]|nr:hypothetical protein diail_9272 [Diaporthe ilicicola]
MSPVIHAIRSFLSPNGSPKHLDLGRDTTSTELRSQWNNPSDVLSLLLILGPDVIWWALAQLSGDYITPVVFSYGWVAYAVNALVSTFGDYPVTVVGAKSGHVRENHSWVIGRLLRDFEQSQTAPRVDKASPRYEALRVSVFQADSKRKAGLPARDWVWYSGFAVILIQVAISAVPTAVYHDWAPILITTSGTTLAFIQGSLRQWREEKWACPTTGGWTVSLTPGNGNILAVGLIGMIHNLVAASLPRGPSALGIHLNQIDTITDTTVSKVLQKTEERYPMVGSSLVPVFFSGGLRIRPEERDFWAKAEDIRESQGLSKLAIKVD